MTSTRKSSKEETDEGFTSRVTEQLVGGVTGIGIAMGMETGLFDVMITNGEKPHTSQEIADTANLKERLAIYNVNVCQNLHLYRISRSLKRG